MMRALVFLLAATALVQTAAFAQTSDRPVKGPPVPDAAPAPVERPVIERITAEPESPVLSTLKPSMVSGDGTQPRQRLVTVFGTEPCPKPESPDEVVVCARLPESEIYRIPEQLRQPESQRSPFEENRALLVGDVAGGGIGSCSAVAAGGAVGCNQKQVDAWARDRTGRMGAEEEIPRR
ncbi:MAG: hypothetical protein ACMVO5_09530 [Polymorphobacter sp.]|uniref:hypothetical protein n=1 Tax=Polymorphobacter sp. TaxID=1909290 RepID=UPI003A86CE64